MSSSKETYYLLSDVKIKRKIGIQQFRIPIFSLFLGSVVAFGICVTLPSLGTNGGFVTAANSSIVSNLKESPSNPPQPPFQQSHKTDIYTSAIEFLKGKKSRLQEQTIHHHEVLLEYKQKQVQQPHVVRISNENARYTVFDAAGNGSHIDAPDFSSPILQKRSDTFKLSNDFDNDDGVGPQIRHEQELNELANRVADVTLYSDNSSIAQDTTSTQSRGRSIDGVSSIFSKISNVLDLGRVVREIETSVMSSVSCSACRAGVSLLNHYIQSGRNNHEIAAAAIKLCINLKMQSPRVCAGICNLYVGEVSEVLRGVVGLDSNDLCAVIIGESCGEPISPTWRWTVDFPPIEKPPFTGFPEPKKGSPKLKVLQISDVHFDPYYEPASNANCDEPLCCRITSGPKPPRPHLGAGMWGDYRKCDTPIWTIESMFEHINQNHADIDYILWTGDIPAHDVWNQTKKGNIKLIRETVSMLQQYFPSIPIFPALGNHESNPVNSFAPPWVKNPKYSIDWLYAELQNQWSRLLPDSTHSTIRNGAFYSTIIKPGFKLISINTNYCNNKNWWLLVNSTDPVDELKWLIFELQSSELAQERVHIIGHIPPGHADCLATWSRNYYDIISRYESTIAAQFFGHTHYDELEIFYAKEDPYRASSIAYIGPSVTPYYNLNPGYRIYYVDGDYDTSTWSVIDHETWVTDLGEANRVRAQHLTWYKLYSAIDAYGMTSLNPLHWDDLVMSMYKNKRLFNLYYRFYNKNSPVAPDCDEECKNRLICDMRSGKSHAREELCKPRPVHVRSSRGGLTQPNRPPSKIYQILDFISNAFSSIMGYISYPFG